MYRTRKDKYYLQLFLHQPDDPNPKAEEIKECGKKCSLRRFYKIFDAIIPDDFEKECRGKKDDTDPTDKPEKTTTESPDSTDEPTKPTKRTKPPGGGTGAAAVNGNGRVFSIILCSLWFIRKLFSKFYYEIC